MELHPLAKSFASVADSYEHGRPRYTPAVIAALSEELSLGAGAAVLDLAAGTGKLTRALLDAGFDVRAVEPQAPLRALLEASVGERRVSDGTAEAIPLADASVDAVTVADAFHWFDHAPALAEIARVLRPGGGLAVITTVPDWSGASWAHELGTLIAGERTSHPQHDGTPWQESVRSSGVWSAPRERRVSAPQPADVERVLSYVASMSWIAALARRRREELLARVRELLVAGHTPSEMPFHFLIGTSTLL
jgi:SAM-dependent methyltransferase